MKREKGEVACDFRSMHPCLHTCPVRCLVKFSCCATRTNQEVHSETLLHQAKQSEVNLGHSLKRVGFAAEHKVEIQNG